MACCARGRRRSFIVPLYLPQFRVSRRYVPYPETGGAPCPSRSSRPHAARPGPTVLTATTRARRHGLTCRRSARPGRAARRPEATRPDPDATAAPAVPLARVAGGTPLAWGGTAGPTVLTPAPTVPIRVLTALAVTRTAVAALVVTAATTARTVPLTIPRPQGSPQAPAVLVASGPPPPPLLPLRPLPPLTVPPAPGRRARRRPRATTSRCRRGPSGRNPGTAARRTCRPCG